MAHSGSRSGDTENDPDSAASTPRRNASAPGRVRSAALDRPLTMAKPEHKNRRRLRVLTDEELTSVAGGNVSQDGQIFQALSSALSEVMKNFGSALQTAARG